jgi:RNA polymerase sigma-70 factor (ECF subfamily)
MGAHDDEAGPMSVADMAALARLFQEHRARLLTMLRRRIDPRLSARIDAEGVLAEAFVAARRKWPRFEASGMSPYAWLYGIVRDCLIEAWRRENRESRRPDKEIPWPERSSDQMAIGLMGSLTSPSEALDRGELQERVRQALDALRPPDREILWMRHFDDLPFRDVAVVLGITEDAAMQRYSRALRRVKDLWKELFDRGGSEP